MQLEIGLEYKNERERERDDLGQIPGHVHNPFAFPSATKLKFVFSCSVSGCLLDNAASRGPPDVPPRNPTMSRLNGRLPGSHVASDHERDPDLEPHCLVRTPSGNFYNIPSK